MHVPVLLTETLQYLNATKGQKFIDCTIGSGGHSIAIIKENPSAQILGIDWDQVSLGKLQLEFAQKNLDRSIHLVWGNYQDLDKIAHANNFDSVDGILLDLGFSSSQIDDAARGFSFQTNGPLDMRYSEQNPLRAADIVNRYKLKDLEKIFSQYGEEKFFRKVAFAIVRARTTPIDNSIQLAEIIKNALPPFVRFKANDTLRRVFQALRIEVNHELENLKVVLPKALQLLKSGGRLVVISFHSLEDRMVKEFFNHEAKDCVCPPEFPTCICDKASKVRILTRKVVVPLPQEVEENPRSASAKLRAIEKI
ncbi:MAG: 16S rRNA (cytosine(1402)-N(4))-methyltransferase [Candidatus Doudnabacteria bacterium RIFCSPLOWO2_01_FULL_44_21]|uniref:Ribosomal RNA small subunit methyltransferase H n=1 Tax=Candidatus Doudnabacteria bacterium RIFCSPLOWO2_01_FULL_44_21 TaxID=1817841 RepID=A0A1F5PXI3_9BACT|nr:MAG: 16S rRNA (cytosine(1402)-N(4))-methyltransferase [Candidatus Doudnabacteria bacterium RIFCSPHIGHO2_02_FULL_43_13b]OGE94625.1 MAG: 16S rRNA (cytosine(1402)-N(4))-methyltransferase [Candidatus Doudnabacteria bacterium RIFCSPLOWO2_01_FULL_44_21]